MMGKMEKGGKEEMMTELMCVYANMSRAQMVHAMMRKRLLKSLESSSAAGAGKEDQEQRYVCICVCMYVYVCPKYAHKRSGTPTSLV